MSMPAIWSLLYRLKSDYCAFKSCAISGQVILYSLRKNLLRSSKAMFALGVRALVSGHRHKIVLLFRHRDPKYKHPL